MSRTWCERAVINEWRQMHEQSRLSYSHMEVCDYRVCAVLVLCCTNVKSRFIHSGVLDALPLSLSLRSCIRRMRWIEGKLKSYTYEQITKSTIATVEVATVCLTPKPADNSWKPSRKCCSCIIGYLLLLWFFENSPQDNLHKPFDNLTFHSWRWHIRP